MKSRTRQRGSQVVEAGLTLTVFFGLVLGLFSFGVVLFAEQSLIHGIREGARYGAVHAYKDDSQLISEVRNVALCRDPNSCSGAFGFVPSDVTVTCPAAGAPSGQACQNAQLIVVSLPAHSWATYSPLMRGFSARAIEVRLPIENQTGAVN